VFFVCGSVVVLLVSIRVCSIARYGDFFSLGRFFFIGFENLFFVIKKRVDSRVFVENVLCVAK